MGMYGREKGLSRKGHGGLAVRWSSDLPSLTKQEFRKESDINEIMRKYKKTGVLPQVGPGIYGDFSSVTDYQSALESVVKAERLFLSVPAAVS